MSRTRPDRFRYVAGWSAYGSASLAIIGALFLALFYALDVPRMSAAGGGTSQTVFGAISDGVELLQFLVLAPVVVALHQMVASPHRGLSRILAAIGVAGILTVGIAQALLLAQIISFAVNLPYVLAGFVLIGVWMAVANHLGRAAGAVSSQLAWLGELTGAEFAVLGGLTLVYVLASALTPRPVAHLATLVQHNPALIATTIVVFVPAILAYFVGVPIWLIWLGRRLLSAGAPEPSERQLAPIGSLQ
jgi:hypothetical protein